MGAQSAVNMRQPANPQQDCVEVLIQDIDARGRGIARADGKKILVDGALAGETVRIRRRKRHRRADVADLVDVLRAAPERTAPSCTHFSLCGGCRFQHLSGPAQRGRKNRAFSEALARHWLSPPERALPPIFDRPAGYRRKARLGVRYVAGKGGALVGFREKRVNFVADLKSCEVLVPAAGERITALRDLVSGLGARERIPQIEIAAGERDTALVFRHLGPLTASDRRMMVEFARRHAVQVYLQSAGPESVVPLWPETPPPLTYSLPEFDLELAFQPTDFVQVNAGVNRKLVGQAVELLDVQPNDRVLDLFCGIGNFTLALARRGGGITGVEYSEDMVRAAKANAARNGIENVDFRRLDLEDAGGAADCLSQSWDKLILDPPRSGAVAVTGALGSPYPRRIVYVSCNPDTFARDAAVLVQKHGYHFERAGIVDMFPHTGRVEVIGAFARGTE